MKVSTQYAVTVPATTTSLLFGVDCHEAIANLSKDKTMVLLIDEKVYQAQMDKWQSYERIVIIPSGESAKTWKEVERIIDLLLQWQLDRKAILIGVGGGVVTDLVGFVAAIYKRGITCAFVPTTILAMVDAAVGGKNGINVGEMKNMVGAIVQPKAIIYDYSLLDTLSDAHWANGFAEIIKHAAIKDAAMFAELASYHIDHYKNNIEALNVLIQRNVNIKVAVIENDPFENGERKLLNFGHTLAHAIEKHYDLLHGYAVSIGMIYAAQLSANHYGFKDINVLQSVLEQYHLPTSFDYDFHRAIALIQVDKKTNGAFIDFILLQEIGKAIITPIAISNLKNEYND